jgi:hypothetical protein
MVSRRCRGEAQGDRCGEVDRCDDELKWRERARERARERQERCVCLVRVSYNRSGSKQAMAHTSSTSTDGGGSLRSRWKSAVVTWLVGHLVLGIKSRESKSIRQVSISSKH